MNDDALRQVFEERARRLARDEVAGRGRDEAASMLLLSLGKMRFGVPLEAVREVVPVETVTPVPFSPPCLAGLLNLRGAVVPAVDLNAFLGLSGGLFDRTAGLVCGEDGDLVVLLVGAVLDLVSHPGAEALPPPAGLPSSALAFLEGTSPDGAVLLRAEAVLEDPRLIFEPWGEGGR